MATKYYLDLKPGEQPTHTFRHENIGRLYFTFQTISHPALTNPVLKQILSEFCRKNPFFPALLKYELDDPERSPLMTFFIIMANEGGEERHGKMNFNLPWKNMNAVCNDYLIPAHDYLREHVNPEIASQWLEAASKATKTGFQAQKN